MSADWSAIPDGAEATPALFNNRFEALNKGNVHNALAYGATGDGTTDDTSALTTAIAAAGRGVVFLPPGTYAYTSSLSLTDTTLVGVPGETVLKPAASCGTRPLILQNRGLHGFGYQIPTFHEGLIIDGSSATTGAAIDIGGDATSSLVCLRNCLVRSFSGSSSAGLRITNVVQAHFENVVVRACADNVVVGAAGGTGLPTAIQFDHCNIREATNVGVRVSQAYKLRFTGNTVIESNEEEAVYVAPAASQVIEELDFSDVWFENNHSSATTKADQFVVKIVGGGQVVDSVRFNECRFGETARLVSAGGVNHVQIRAPQFEATQTSSNFSFTGCGAVDVNHWSTVAPLPSHVTVDSTTPFYVDGWAVAELATDYDSMNDGSSVTVAYNVAGAKAGHPVTTGYTSDLSGIQHRGYCVTDDSVIVELRNETGGAANPSAATLRIAAQK